MNPVSSLPKPPTIETGDQRYGYLLVHFVEDAEGYTEKIYFDISNGDDPERWDRLNGGAPILASSLGTTGIRDPFLTFNPHTRTYYLIATDLRVWSGPSTDGDLEEWAYWSRRGSTRLNVWTSHDLISWSEQSQFDLAVDVGESRVRELGMAWAPKATWVDDFEGRGGRFVFTWSSNVWPLDDPAHEGDSYSRVLWGTTTDFSSRTFEYGGEFVDIGANTIDTAVIPTEEKTYRITKDNGTGMGLYMESTMDAQWWRRDAKWTLVQTIIGGAWTDGTGHVEGPAAFRCHSDDVYYLYVDVIPTGYRPMFSRNLDEGWSKLDSPDFTLAPFTKHGNVIGLTRREYEALRTADAVATVSCQVGAIELQRGSTPGHLRAALPRRAAVLLAHGRGRAELPIDWMVDDVDLDVAGIVSVSGSVRSIGANNNSWIGADGSTEWNAPAKRAFSVTSLSVTATVHIVDEQ